MSEIVEPQVGDDWEFKLPGKPKRVKTGGRISQKTFLKEAGSSEQIELPYVNWKREPKGRYTGITVRRLMEFGHRVSTKAERDARLNAQIERAKERRRIEREQS